MAVDVQNVLPAILIDIEKGRAPAEKLRMNAESGAHRDIGKRHLAQVAIERRRVVGEIGLEDIELAVAVVVAGGGTHAGLLAAVFVQGRPGHDTLLGKRTVPTVVKQQAGGGVASDKDVGPAVVVVVAGEDGEAVVTLGGGDAGRFRNIGKLTAIVAQQRHALARQPAGPAGDGQTLPDTLVFRARLGRVGGVELEIVGEEQVEVAVPIIVEEGAARGPAPLRLRGQHRGLVAKRAIALIVQQGIRPPIGNDEVQAAVVVIVPGAGALAKTGGRNLSLLGDVGELQLSEIAVEMMLGPARRSLRVQQTGVH